jgi:hypothetical protein
LGAVGEWWTGPGSRGRGLPSRRLKKRAMKEVSQATGCASQLHLALQFQLELADWPIMFWSCRFTNFIARNATRTAKCWCAPVVGRAPSAPIAAQPGFPRSSRSSLPPTAAALKRPRARAAPGPAVAIAPVANTSTERVFDCTSRIPTPLGDERSHQRESKGLNPQHFLQVYVV